jgi:hypothetical protein
MSFIITVKSARDLEKLLYAKITLIDRDILTQKEIYQNFHGFDCSEIFIKDLTLNYLQTFVKKLVENRKQQVTALHHEPGAVFYLWYDEQTLQIRFNVLSGKNRPLPFASHKTECLNSPDTILHRYLDDALTNAFELELLDTSDQYIDDNRIFVDALDFDQDQEIEHITYIYLEQFDGFVSTLD